ncbi:Rz1-like lysis system protein LysC [Aquidulcibacter sp.]|uniref:Rz1-like lysis system protein LysC n=1 Tax=Aquidulcibacter sp. TaxID=2052990 RepID=UPI00345D4017
MTWKNSKTNSRTSRLGLIALSLLTFSGCVSTKQPPVPQVCKVDEALKTRVEAPAGLTNGATNQDMWNRMLALEGALEMCNQRLQAIK